MYLYILTKYGLVYILGDFFHKLIWSAVYNTFQNK
jgi:hypothetical protein